jgi:1,4-alpha-glucan branching enzyme
MTATGGGAFAPPSDDAERLARGEHHDPHAILGRHGDLVRAFHPDASAVTVLAHGGETEMTPLGAGLWGATVEDDGAYRLRFTFGDGNHWEHDDPYRFLPTLGELDLHLISEGTHERLYDVLGGHPRTVDGVAGVAFAVWAPGARGVRIVGDFDRWDGRLMPMRSLGASGVWELFIPMKSSRRSARASCTSSRSWAPTAACG